MMQHYDMEDSPANRAKVRYQMTKFKKTLTGEGMLHTTNTADPSVVAGVQSFIDVRVDPHAVVLSAAAYLLLEPFGNYKDDGMRLGLLLSDESPEAEIAVRILRGYVTELKINQVASTTTSQAAVGQHTSRLLKKRVLLQVKESDADAWFENTSVKKHFGAGGQTRADSKAHEYYTYSSDHGPKWGSKERLQLAWASITQALWKSFAHALEEESAAKMTMPPLEPAFAVCGGFEKVEGSDGEKTSPPCSDMFADKRAQAKRRKVQLGLVREGKDVVYYITGCIEAFIAKTAHRNPRGAMYRYYIAWVAENNIGYLQAAKQGLPVALTVERRGRRGPCFPSAPMFDFVCRIEAAYKLYATGPGLATFGSSLVVKISKMVAADVDTRNLFNITTKPVLDHAKKHFDPADAAKESQLWIEGMDEIFNQIISYFRRMRGKEVVSMLMARLSKKERAKGANSLRSQMAAQAANPTQTIAKDQASKPCPHGGGEEIDEEEEENYDDEDAVFERRCALMESICDELDGLDELEGDEAPRVAEPEIIPGDFVGESTEIITGDFVGESTVVVRGGAAA
jgi:hypothetical protein